MNQIFKILSGFAKPLGKDQLVKCHEAEAEAIIWKYHEAEAIIWKYHEAEAIA